MSLFTKAKALFAGNRPLPEDSNQTIICVLGMHRSGTSVLTRMLNLLGVTLGAAEALTTEPVAFNPKGYWEHHELTAISDAILKRYNGDWEAPPRLPRGWEHSRKLEDLRSRARQLTSNQFGATDVWGWKDPRTCLTLPFWQQLFPHMQYIICLRNPVDVARSLEQRDNFSREQSSRLWFTYVASALHYTEGRTRLVVFYEDLMDNCQGELARLGQFLRMPERAADTEVVNAAQEFIEKSLQHYRTSLAELLSDDRIDARARDLYLSQRESLSRGTKATAGDRSV
jgi:hypothetical protein